MQAILRTPVSVTSMVQILKMGINIEKSVNVTFTLPRDLCPPVILNNSIISSSDIVWYLGQHLDKYHLESSRTTANVHKWTGELLIQLIDTHSKPSLSHRLQTHNTILQVFQTYGIEFHSSKKSSTTIAYRLFNPKSW